jgi:hypothetical protein
MRHQQFTHASRGEYRNQGRLADCSRRRRRGTTHPGSFIPLS